MIGKYAVKNKGFLLSTLLLIGVCGFVFQAGAASYYLSGEPNSPTPGAPCYDIEGISTPVLISGIDNSGVINFDLSPAELDPKYAACVKMNSITSATADPAILKGWTWDDNLGWISLYCGDENADGFAPYTNLGVACGSVSYSVTIAVTGAASRPDYTSVKMSGYAWGDNIGWIQFNSAFHQLEPLPSGANRGLIDPARVIPQKENYLWADSVGWINLSGVKFPWLNTAPPDKVVLCSSSDVSGTSCVCDLVQGCLSSTIPLADNTQSWNLNVIPFDGVAIGLAALNLTCPASLNVATDMGPGGGKTHALCIQLAWVDSVDLDQTTKTSQDGAAPRYSATSYPTTPAGGAVSKPVSTISSMGAVTADGFGFKVTSRAPTSDQNKYSDGFLNEKFIYADPAKFTGATNYDRTKTNQNTLTLSSFNVMFFRYKTASAPGSCLYGNFNAGTGICTPKNYASGSLSFRPPVNLTMLYQPVGTKLLNFLSLVYGAPTKLQYFATLAEGTNAVVIDPKIQLITNVEDTFSKYKIDILDATLNVQAPPFYISALTVWSFMMDALPTDLLVNLDALNPEDPPTSDPSNALPYLYSVVSYNIGGVTTQYFGAKLPRIKAGILKNPVASVAGNIYATGISKKGQSQADIKSLGNVASNWKRAQISKNVSKYLAGFDQSVNPLASGDKTVNLNTTISGLTLLQSRTLAGVTNEIYYLDNGNLTINCGGDCTSGKNITFIVNNGSIVLQNDIVPIGANQVGLIALKDPNSIDYRLGNLYVASNVTDIIQTQVYLDRLMLSYSTAKGITSSADKNGGWPVFADDFERQDLLNNQLRFAGTISSLNGFGIATSVKKYNEDGKEIAALPYVYSTSISAAAPTGLARARTADLNFMRYYGPGLQICDATIATSPGELQNVPRDLQGTSAEDCNPSAAAYAINATALPANGGDLVLGTGGGGVKSAKYAPMTDLASEFPTYFEYLPISKSLFGFEGESGVNPTEKT